MGIEGPSTKPEASICAFCKRNHVLNKDPMCHECAKIIKKAMEEGLKQVTINGKTFNLR